MWWVLHGENIIASRQRLFELSAQAKHANRQIYRWAGQQLKSIDLSQYLTDGELFGQPKLIIIEELHSGPAGKFRDRLLSNLRSYHNDQIQVILWEKRLLPTTTLQKLPQAKIETFKISPLVFKWLDLLRGQHYSTSTSLTMLHQALAQHQAGFIWAMLIKQIRLLIQVQTHAPLKLAPFRLTKLTAQARTFSLEQLLAHHHRLLTIDWRQKTSATSLSLEQELDLFCLSL